MELVNGRKIVLENRDAIALGLASGCHHNFDLLDLPYLHNKARQSFEASTAEDFRRFDGLRGESQSMEFAFDSFRHVGSSPSLRIATILNFINILDPNLEQTT